MPKNKLLKFNEAINHFNFSMNKDKNMICYGLETQKKYFQPLIILKICLAITVADVPCSETH